jgi:hypothetical protein
LGFVLLFEEFQSGKRIQIHEDMEVHCFLLQMYVSVLFISKEMQGTNEQALHGFTDRMGWTIGVLGFDSLRGLGIFLFTTAIRTAVGPTQPPFQWVPGALSLGAKRPRRA